MSKPVLTKAEVLRRIALGEGQSTEFKETTGQIRPAVKTVAAFAGQPDGGCVIIGINDDGIPNARFQIGKKTQEEVAQAIKANTLSITAAALVDRFVMRSRRSHGFL